MSYLVVITLRESEEAVVDGVLATAASFLGTAGAMERRELGRYTRNGRAGKESEILRLVEFRTKAEEDSKRAKTLESVVRSTFAAAEAEDAEVRVFISRGELDAER